MASAMFPRVISEKTAAWRGARARPVRRGSRRREKEREEKEYVGNYCDLENSLRGD